MLRVNLFWPEIEIAQGVYDVEKLDWFRALKRECKDHGIKIKWILVESFPDLVNGMPLPNWAHDEYIFTATPDVQGYFDAYSSLDTILEFEMTFGVYTNDGVEKPCVDTISGVFREFAE